MAGHALARHLRVVLHRRLHCAMGRRQSHPLFQVRGEGRPFFIASCKLIDTSGALEIVGRSFISPSTCRPVHLSRTSLGVKPTVEARERSTISTGVNFCTTTSRVDNAAKLNLEILIY